MSRKVFLSFLGTNNYIACNYYYEQRDNKISNVRFVQEAALQLLCNEFEEKDQVIVFATDEARKKNWLDNGQDRAQSEDEKIGLHTRLVSLADNRFKGQIPENTIPIPEGFSSQEVWDIFETVFGELNSEDQVYLDITHSFRFVPMLATVLLQYAKFLKSIEVKSISYGAFEALGPAYQVKEIDLEKRDAPIVEVSSLDTLQDWSSAADEFIGYGGTKKLQKLVENESLRSNLMRINGIISAARGIDIIDGKDFEEAISLFSKIDKPALTPIVEVIRQEIRDYKRNDILNGFRAVEWCINHNLTQQGITLLQEFIVSYVMAEIGYREDLQNQAIRNLVSGALSKKNIDGFRYIDGLSEGELADHERIVEAVFALPYKKRLTKNVVVSISVTYRNDINHAGFRDAPKPAQDIIDALPKYYERTKKILDL